MLITGASSGVGRAAAQRFARDGAELVLVSRSEQKLRETAAECRRAGARSVAVEACDVTDRAAVRAVVARAIADHPRLDVVVHAAAVAAYGTVEQLPADVYERVVDTILHGTANVARTVLPEFRRQGHGSLIVVTSLLSSITAPNMGAYVTGKWGQLGLLRVLQQETRDAPGISISAVSPGGVDTPIYYQAATILGRHGNAPPPAYSPERVAKAIVRCVRHPRREVQAGLLNPVIILGFRLTPALFDLLVGPLLRRLGLARGPGEGELPPTAGNVFHPVPEGERVRGRAGS